MSSLSQKTKNGKYLETNLPIYLDATADNDNDNPELQCPLTVQKRASRPTGGSNLSLGVNDE